MLTLGITGTDTGVGKTTVACSLLAMLREGGISTAVMKPVETGVLEDEARSDAARLRALATVAHPMELVRPYRFDAPLAPMAAAELTGHRILFDELDRAFHELRRSAEVMIVEGSGGALVPLSDSISVVDLFRRWALDVIIVAANRLGVLNHALLTERALRASDCRVAAIVLVDTARGDESSRSNARILTRMTSTPLYSFPWIAEPFDERALAAAAMQAGFDALVPSFLPPTAYTR